MCFSFLLACWRILLSLSLSLSLSQKEEEEDKEVLCLAPTGAPTEFRVGVLAQSLN
jgi:hypothetical protein